MKTTIPVFIAKQMNLNMGDTLNWRVSKIGYTWMAVMAKRSKHDIFHQA